ncbi:MAG TPA: hypothetical protein PLE19_13785 [Planctomycetota bacterium]|nr:hypothetical protein [Planctomycetota bacterium]HRR80614.1 hypothetical protein [Planctomycetota bacterium]HRT95321.1 hypothetical protein [Planctomycetota bacterium]
MRNLWILAAALALAGRVAAGGEGQWRLGQPSQYQYQYGYPYGQPPVELSVEQQRKLGLSDEQIQKIAELRRDLEKERAKLDAQLKAASEAAAAANAEVSRLSQEVRAFSTTRLQKIYDAVLTPEQRKALDQQRYLEQAKAWLRGYQTWLKLTEAQVEDISNLLVPVFEKYAKMDDEAADARERLAELRRADKLDIAAIEKAEKEVEELSKRNVYQQRQEDLMDRMRAGLLPDQLEKIGQMRRH